RPSLATTPTPRFSSSTPVTSPWRPTPWKSPPRSASSWGRSTSRPPDPHSPLLARQRSHVSSDITVVLAHGAWADGSSWANVINRVEAAGIRAVAAPLRLTSLRDDVAALDHTLEHVDGPVVLAGHAYAGAVIGSTMAVNVRALVYVAALAPDE